MATIQAVIADFDIMLADHDPYVFGGISFYTGADCSGWLYESLVKQGVENVARTSQEQFGTWKVAPGPGYGIAVFFDVPADGTRPGDQPGHVALCLGNGTMAEEPHTGLDAEIAPIPNIPGVESIMGYRYLPVSYGTPATPTTTTTAPSKPAPITGGVFMIPSNCSDTGALRAQIREWWVTFRSDVMLGSDSDLFALVFTESAANKGYGGDPDLLLAGIIDDAKTKNALRPQFVNAV